MPALRTIDCFHDDPGYVKALARNVNDYWVKNGRPDVLLMSFHGLPRRSLDRGDPYHCQCRKTGPPARRRAGSRIPAVRRHVPVRFGAAEWLKPYTLDTLVQLGKEGYRTRRRRLPRLRRRLPGNAGGDRDPVQAEVPGRGGREFHVIPCLNEHPAWIGALVDLLVAHLGGWLAPPPDAVSRELTKMRANDLEAGSGR
jgi:ferrochelatase